MMLPAEDAGQIINGAPATSINPSTLRNPECLKLYERFAEELRVN